MTERVKRIKDNAMFEKDQRNFYKKIGKNENFQGEQLKMEKFTEFWGGIWEKEEVTPMLPWMDNVKEELKASINTAEEFTIEEERLIKIAKKRKNWKKRTIDDLKTYQGNHKMLQIVNEIIVQASNDTGACYGVSKCAEIFFERGQMVKGEGLEVLHARMKTIDPDENVTYKFLGVEQADGIKTKEVFERIKTELDNRLGLLIKTELNDRNLMKAINSKVIPVAAYPMNVCRFSKEELLELDQIIKRQLRRNNMLGRQSSDERLYLKREEGGRGLKSL